MQVKHFRKFPEHRLELLFKNGIAQHTVSRLDGRWFALDMGEDGGDLRHFRPDLGFKMRHQIMRVLQAHGLVEFEMLFHMEWAAEVLDADVMNAEVVP